MKTAAITYAINILHIIFIVNECVKFTWFILEFISEFILESMKKVNTKLLHRLKFANYMTMKFNWIIMIRYQLLKQRHKKTAMK